MRQTTTPHRGPGVHFPPPLLFVTGFLAAYALERFWPSAGLIGRPQVVEVVGAIIAAAGLALGAWALSVFALAGTAVRPHRPASQLVRHGPYRYTRNPMYVALTLLYTGLSLSLHVLWALPLLPVVLVLLHRLVIAREERYLAATFGTEYTEYTSDVRRWF